MDTKKSKSIRIQIRLDERKKNIAQIKADLYFKGNLSKWLKYCLDNPNMKNIPKKEDS